MTRFDFDAAEGIILVSECVVGIWHAFAFFKVSFLISPASSCVFGIGEAEEVVVLVVAVLGDEIVGIFAGVEAVADVVGVECVFAFGVDGGDYGTVGVVGFAAAGVFCDFL